MPTDFTKCRMNTNQIVMILIATEIAIKMANAGIWMDIRAEIAVMNEAAGTMMEILFQNR